VVNRIDRIGQRKTPQLERRDHQNGVKSTARQHVWPTCDETVMQVPTGPFSVWTGGGGGQHGNL